MVNTFISKFYSIIIVVLSTFLISLVIAIYFLNMNRESLIKDLTDKKIELSNEQANNITLTSKLEYQNQKIAEQENNYEAKLKEFQSWKDKPAEIKYKEIIKHQEVKSNECKDIKNIINDIRNTSF